MRVADSTSPRASITALKPLAVTRNCGSRVSMLRKAATARCGAAQGCSVNHESLDIVTMSCAPSRAPSTARPVSTSSRQISGSTGISRPSASRKGNTRAPLPGRHWPAQGSAARSPGPSSQDGTASVKGNSRVLR